MRLAPTALSLAVTVATAAAWQGDSVVHMSKEPRHKVVFESATMRVQDVQIPPGDTSLFHTHDHAVLYVTIGTSRTRSQVLGGEWSGGGAAAGGGAPTASEAPRGPGRVYSVLTYVDTPMTHRVSNIGDTLFRLIAVGNLTKGAAEDSGDLSGLAGKPEVVNRYYRAYRISLPAGQATAAHNHSWPVVLVQQTGGEVNVDADASTVTLTAPGMFARHQSKGAHRISNAGPTAVEVIEVEVRGAPSQP